MDTRVTGFGVTRESALVTLAYIVLTVSWMAVFVRFTLLNNRPATARRKEGAQEMNAPLSMQHC
ncbi:MAG: hypothetical protein JNL62_13165 [Bryobacterales bacterium]|nr:hypothetical protein [Bryobacterales bacterium]